MTISTLQRPQDPAIQHWYRFLFSTLRDDLDAHLDFLCAKAEADGTLRGEIIMGSFLAISSDEHARLLELLYESGVLDFTSGLAAPVSYAWSMTQFPERVWGAAFWWDLFTIVGYSEEGRPATLPTSSMRLYRGATEEFRAGMSWTDDRSLAEQFATRGWERRPVGLVWTAEVEPWRLFARIIDRSESEYVIDPADLEITVACALDS